MNIAILGAGNVGGTLGKRWLAAGHTVEFAVRNSSSEKVQKLKEEVGKRAKILNFKDISTSIEVFVLCVPWVAAIETLKSIKSLENKIIIDATNPIIMNWEGLNQGLTIGTDRSGAEEIAKAIPNAEVIKAFNTVGWEIMQDPNFNGQSLTLPFCGDDGEAKAKASTLIADLGFDPVDVGPLKSARYTEPFAMLWIDMAILRGFGRDIGFQLIKR